MRRTPVTTASNVPGVDDRPDGTALDLPTIPRRRAVDRIDTRLVNVLTVLGFALPTLLYLWVLHADSVNVIVGDQFDDITVINDSYRHLFDWGSLWAQHNENRIFFPNLIVILLSRTTHFNVRIEEYLSAAMLLAAIVLLIWSHKRRSPAVPWLYYCPVAVLGLSLVQYENMLWGFQMAWYLVLLALIVALFLLDFTTLTGIAFVGAIAASAIGSFSSLQGLLIWPAGLVLLYHRRRPPAFLVVWIAASVGSALLYFHNFASGGSFLYKVAWHHPGASVRFFLFEVGDIVGFRTAHIRVGNAAVSALGLVIVIVAILVIIVFGTVRDTESGNPLGAALICVGLLFAAIVTVGRLFGGYVAASASRYTTFDLMIPIGIYLSLLPSPSTAADRLGMVAGGLDHRRIRRALVVAARWGTAAVIVVQVTFGTYYGFDGAQHRHTGQVAAVKVSENFEGESDWAVAQLYLFGGSVPFIRHQLEIAKARHLSLFVSVPTNRTSAHSP
jgi:hypothetical protein